MFPSIYFHIHRFAYSREGKIPRNIPLGLRISINGKSQRFAQSTPFFMLPCRAELEGKALFLGIGEVQGTVGKLVAVAHAVSNSCIHTYAGTAQQ